MIISGVYKIVNTETNQIYIGSSINLNKRKNDHFYLLKKNKIVCQYTLDNILIKEWISINDIERTLKYYASHISKCCNNKKKTAYGHIWKFKQQ